MIIEYCSYDISLSDEEFKQNINCAISYKPKSISVLSPYVRLAKNLLPEDITLCSSIDYPLGTSDTKNRNMAIETSIKSGAKIINLVSQPYYFCNRKYDKFRDDIKSNLEICNKHSVELRYTLEYRVFTYELLYKVSQILLDIGVNTIYPSSGYLLDDINDNILATALINKKIPINIIANGNIWNISQIKTVYKANLFGIMVNSTNALKLLSENNSSY
jgi:deoxyribose-phosphate aldolase